MVDFNSKLSKKYGTSVIGSFSTHDELSPMLINGEQFSKMIIWLNSTLPVNPYYVDGFTSGDNYNYAWANRKAMKSFTDDEYYFAHKGKIDIFNFSRRPGGRSVEVFQEFILGARLREFANKVVVSGDFVTFKTNQGSVFAYARTFNKASVVVIGNLDFKSSKMAVVNIPKLTPEANSIPIKITNIPIISKGKIKTELAPGEVQVLFFDGLSVK